LEQRLSSSSACQSKRDLIESAEGAEPIEDNSFFIEEAYNQERGVVQHIITLLQFLRHPKDTFFSLSQEWPIGSQRHQISYSFPFSQLDANSISGTGDVLINYRYQLLDKTSWAAVAPRLSVILLTGDSYTGFGYGTVGVQINIPISRRLC
jgi:hypothetical protein